MNSQVKAILVVLRSILRSQEESKAVESMRSVISGVYGDRAGLVHSNGSNGTTYKLMIFDYKRVQKPEWKVLRKRWGDYITDDHLRAALLLYGSEFDDWCEEFTIGRAPNTSK